MISTRHTRAGRWAALAIFSLFASTACNNDKATAPTPVLTSLGVTLSATSIVTGTKTNATVIALDQNGAPISGGTVVWSTLSAAVATVNTSTGEVTGVAAGTTQVIATSGTVTGQASLTVTPQPAALNSIAVALSAASIVPGQTSNGTVTALDQYGAAFTAPTVTWTSATPATATVNATTGVVTAVATGTTQIVATGGGKTAQSLLTVVASPAIKVNEVESNGGTPGDWIELYNATAASVDISGWGILDNDNTHAVYKIPNGTSIAAGGYYVVEEAAMVFGLGAADDARLYNQFGSLVDSYTWTAHAATTYGRCAPNGTGAFVTTTSSTKGAANDCSIAVKVNEVESDAGTPGDWIELYNAGGAPVDIGGYVLKDNDDTHSYAIPAGTSIAAGAFLVFDEATFGFGLGAADAARLFNPTGTLIDSYVWTAHAAITYGRCPDGTGAFAATTASTKGTANNCTPIGPVISAWPGATDITTVDIANTWTSNLSGLMYEGAAGATPAAIWAVVNGPGTLFRLVASGTNWSPDPSNGWGAGKSLKYTDGNGNPDSEGVTFTTGSSAGIYVSTERNNDASTVSRLSILRYDPTVAGATLTATNDWNLTADIPAQGANLGLEAITWIPDTFLTGKNFFDVTKGHAYTPSEYPNHGSGLFFVGVEGNGNVYVYALNHADNTYSRITSFSSTFPAGIMDLYFDRETGYLWGECDDTCQGLTEIFEIDQTAGATLGRFKAPRQFNRPTGMANVNNEGFTLAPEAECVGGRKPAFWSDDNNTDGHSLRRGLITCGTIAAPAIRAQGTSSIRRP